MKIGQYLAKIWTSGSGLLFLAHPVELCECVDVCVCVVVSAGDLNSMCEVKGAPVDMMLFVLDADDNLVTFSEQRDAKGVSIVSVLSLCYSQQRKKEFGTIH